MFNTKSMIYQTEWLDLVFANRNKSYGAYELRLNYNRRLGRALLLSSLPILMLFLYPLIEKRVLTDAAQPVPYHTNDEIIDVSLPPLEQRKEKNAPAAAAPELSPLKIKSTRFVKPVVVNTQVNENPPTLAELQNSAIATQSSDWIKSSSDINVAESGDMTGVNL
ncbi:hypothetical protein WG906_18060 [Pedobacter sp. P351]|uniref:hypothetical protein n=1 Tax=Pedobacter superstes TaxID=3133441 RepID=UPI00309C20C0